MLRQHGVDLVPRGLATNEDVTTWLDDRVVIECAKRDDDDLRCIGALDE